MADRITKSDLKRELGHLESLTGDKFKAEVSPVGNWWTLYRQNPDTSLSRVSLPDTPRAGLPTFVYALRAFRCGLLYAERGF